MIQLRSAPIAVVGVSALFPGSIDKNGFWRDILAGRDLLTDVPKSHWLVSDYYDADPKARDKTYARRGGFLGEVDFDPLAWGIPPSNVPSTDTTQLLSLIVAQQVLQDACGSQFATMSRDRISVILGVTSAQELLGSMVSRLQRPVWVKSLREMGLTEPQVIEAADRIASHYVEWQESTFPGVLGNVVAGRIANRLNLGGTNCVTDAACASSFSALAMSVAELRLGQSDLVITGGADTMNDIFMYVCFSKTPALSPTGDCRPFSRRADGTMLGEGIGMVALKRLADAERDGDRIYAVVKGVGSSSDGRSKSVYAPVPEGQAQALRRAYEQAGYSPDTVELIEAHGTGTQAGDAAEFEGLRQVFDETDRRDRQWCALGSVKSQIGHTKAAAGAAGLFKAIMALHHKVLPPTIKVDAPDPRLKIETSPFYLNTAARPWLRDQRHPRRASVSSFGFGGSNFHIALEEYVGTAPRPDRVRPEGGDVVLISAETPQHVAEACRALVRDAPAKGMLAFLARKSQLEFDSNAAARLAVYAESEAELTAKLMLAIDQVANNRSFSAPGGISFEFGPADRTVAFLFPGQGSQYLNMGADLSMEFSTVRRSLDESIQVALGGSKRLDSVMFPIPVFDETLRQAQVDELTATQWAQPAIAAVSLAHLALLRELGVQPTAVAGHSFGEVTALYAAGAISKSDVLRVARRRGECMATASQQKGSMISVSAKRDVVEALLTEWQVSVTVANYNSQNQLVLAGDDLSIVDVERRFTERGIDCTKLQVATAFHSPMVSPASDPLRAFLSTIDVHPCNIDVIQTASAKPYPENADAIRDVLSQQLALPVRFVEQIEALYARGIRTFVEVGPARVLTGLVGHILKGRIHRAIAVDRRGSNGFFTMLSALGQLSVAGVAVDWRRLWSEFASVDDPRAAQMPAMSLRLTGASYGKPYPPPEGDIALPQPNPVTPKRETIVTDQKTPPAAPPPPAIAPNVATAWLSAFQESQRQTAEAHAAFARAMTESHAAFLKSADQSLYALSTLLHASGLPSVALAPQAALPPIALPPPPKPAMEQPSSPSYSYAAPPPAPMLAAPAIAKSAPPPAAPRAASPSPSSPTTLSSEELQSLILNVVAETTGYPKEMIGLDMDLEADLGVDSIKRVQILAATMDRAPGLPEVGANKMASLRTLREIVTELGSHTLGKSVPPAQLPEPGAKQEQKSEVDTTMRLQVVAIPAPAQQLGTPGIFEDQSCVVTNDAAGVGAALVQLLNSRGARARLDSNVRAVGDDRVVISLDALTNCDSATDALEINRRIFQTGRSVASRFASDGGTFITVQDTGGDFGLSGSERSLTAGASAFARTAQAEWPRAIVRSIDIERADRTAQQIAMAIIDELRFGGVESAVGLKADGRRLKVITVNSPISPATLTGFDTNSVIVVSGGGHGVTAKCVVALAKKVHCKFVLLGRTSINEGTLPTETGAALQTLILAKAKAQGKQLTPVELKKRADEIEAVREIRSTLSQIIEAGGQARYESVDICNGPAVAALVNEIRSSWGPIRGVIHGAGVLADKRISDKTDAQFDRVFRTKVLGLETLLDATRADDLTAIVFFSSVAARWGNSGQCDYAMANEVLNKVAAFEQRRRGPSCIVRSIGWGPWNGGMVDASLSQKFSAAGVPLLDLDVGARHLVEELTHRAQQPEVLIVAGDEKRQISHLPEEIVAVVHVSRHTHPFLDGHRVRGAAVVPVALCLEWFSKIAHALRPDLTLVSCRNIQVLSGIRLKNFDASGDTLTLRARLVDATEIEFEILNATSTRHYSASGTLSSVLPKHHVPPPTPSDLTPWEKDIYDGQVLFHGADFQVIRSIDGVSDAGLVAEVAGLQSRAWQGSWRVDPGLLDGGLQLALLWTLHKLGGAGLPTSIENVEFMAAGPIAKSARCILQGRAASKDRSLSDITCIAPDGAVIAHLRGIEVHLLPKQSGRAA